MGKIVPQQALENDLLKLAESSHFFLAESYWLCRAGHFLMSEDPPSGSQTWSNMVKHGWLTLFIYIYM